MKANSKQGQQAGGKRIADMHLRHMLKNSNEKYFLGSVGRLKKAISIDSSPKNITEQVAGCSSAAANISEPESANDAAVGHLRKIFIETGAILPMQRGVIGENVFRAGELFHGDGFIPSILPFEHHLVMAYITSCRQDNRMIYVSPQISNIGFALEAWQGDMDLRLQQAHKDDLVQLETAIQHSRNTGEKFKCNYRLYDSFGKVRWFHDEASVLCDESGAPLYIFGAMLDVTEKMEMEAELKGHRYYLEQGVEQRTEQLMKRVVLLESCNATLGEKLALSQKELAILKQQPEAPPIKSCTDTHLSPAAQTTLIPQSIRGAQSDESTEQLVGVGYWANMMISLTLDNWVKHGCYKPKKIMHVVPATPATPYAQPPQSNAVELNSGSNGQMEAVSDWARNLVGMGSVASEAI